MKKWLIVVLSILSFAACISPFIIVPKLNDVYAQSLADEMKKANLPGQTEIVAMIWDCVNTSGTGNHTEAWVVMLIKTELAREELVEYYKWLYINAYKIDVYEVTEDEKSTLAMNIAQKNFQSLENIQNHNGYYIIERAERNEFYSFFDLRGH